MKRSICCVVLHFDINRAIVGKVLLNFTLNLAQLLRLRAAFHTSPLF